MHNEELRLALETMEQEFARLNPRDKASTTKDVWAHVVAPRNEAFVRDNLDALQNRFYTLEAKFVKEKYPNGR